MHWHATQQQATPSKQHSPATHTFMIWHGHIQIHCHMLTPAPAPAPVQPGKADLPTVVPAAERLVAIGDLHGDFGKARRAFRLAGLTDAEDRWIGGSSVCVQVRGAGT